MSHCGKAYKCHQCGKWLKHEGSLHYHMKLHTGEKPFTCSQCRKSCIHKGHLNCHMKIHERGNNLKCQQCEKSFIEKKHLTRHVKIHRREKPFMCHHCGRTCTGKANLKVHMRLHIGERPYTCLHCEKSFSYSTRLKIHMQTHSGQKSQCSECGKRLKKKQFQKSSAHSLWTNAIYNCNQCNKKFILPSHFEIHLKSHADEKSCLCSLCGQTFKWLCNLRSHLRLYVLVKPITRASYLKWKQHLYLRKTWQCFT